MRCWIRILMILVFILFSKNCSKSHILQSQKKKTKSKTDQQRRNVSTLVISKSLKLTFDLKNQVKAAPSLLFLIHLIPMTLQILLAEK